MGETRELPDDAEITLGTGKLLGIFFGLAAICAVFFTLGYMLGRGSAAGARTEIVGSVPSGNGTANKPSAANNKSPDASSQNCPAGSANCPPAGSGPVLWLIAPCFAAQGNVSNVDVQTYLEYIQLKQKRSRPAEGIWTSYDDSLQQIIKDDFNRLWNTNFLANLRIDVNDTFSNGVVGKIAAALHIAGREPDSQAPGNATSGQLADWIQFDTKGVEFGPWLRAFVAQVKPNWIVPSEAISNKGRVVMTFNVQKDGSITDLTIGRPSSVEAFDNAALSALTASNPLPPLPPEYPAEKAFFTLTFFYNEPAGQTQAQLK